MVYSRCPTCGRGFQRGRGVGSTLADTAKRAMAREMGKRMKVAAIRLQTYGRGNRQKGSGLDSLAGSALKQAPPSEAAKEAASGWRRSSHALRIFPQDQDKGCSLSLEEKKKKKEKEDRVKEEEYYQR